MAENRYLDLWHKLEGEARERHGVEGYVSVDRNALIRSTRQAFTAYMAELYAEQWRPSYALLGLDMTEAKDVLAARAMEVHHWSPAIADATSITDLVKALAQDISHCPYPHLAVRTLEIALSDLPDKRDVIDRLRVQEGPR